MSKRKRDWGAVCNSENQSAFQATSYTQLAGHKAVSAIDRYYGRSRELVVIAKPEQIQAHPILGQLLLLGIVATAETYFRTILAQVVLLCPLARDRTHGQQIPLGHVVDYGADNIGHALFADVSLSSLRAIAQNLETIIGAKMPKNNSSLGEALNHFGELCQLRHAVAHTSGFLSRGNCERIGLSQPSHLRYELSVTAERFQDAVEVCHSAVRAFNRFLFKSIITNWIRDSVLVGDWARDQRLYAPLFHAFYSHIDQTSPGTPYNSYRALHPSIVAGRGS